MGTRVLLVMGGFTLEAQQFSTRSIEVAPGVAPLYQTRAKVLEVMGQYDRALKDLDRTLDLLDRGLQRDERMGQGEQRLEETRRERARYQLHKARIFESKRDVAAARGLYRKVRDEWPHAPEGRKAVNALERIGD